MGDTTPLHDHRRVGPCVNIVAIREMSIYLVYYIYIQDKKQVSVFIQHSTYLCFLKFSTDDVLPRVASYPRVSGLAADKCNIVSSQT